MNLHKICLANYGEKSTIHEAAHGSLKTHNDCRKFKGFKWAQFSLFK